MLRVILALNLCLAAFLPAAASEPPVPETGLDKVYRAKPAPMAPAKPVVMPELEESTLKSGLKLALMGLGRLPIVSLQIVLPFAGYRSDPEGKSGLAELTAGLLTEGTQNRDSLQFAKAMEKLGARIGINFSERETGVWWRDALVISVFALKEKLEPALALTAEMINFPAMPAKELARIKEETTEGLRQEKSDPAALSHRRLEEKVFGGHPYARHPDEASINSITREEIVAAHEKNFTPAIITASGDISMEELKGLAEKYFPGDGALIGAPSPAVPAAEAAAPGTLEIEIIDQPGSSQSNIAAGHLSIPKNHPDFFPLVVMNSVLGDGSGGRLKNNIREAHGWAYYAGSGITTMKDAGLFAVRTSVQTDKTADAVTEILKEIRRIQETPAGAEEIAKARKVLAGNFILYNRRVQELSENIARIELYGLPKDYLAAYRGKIMAVTAEDIQRVARTYLDAGAMRFVIAGDAEKIYGELSKLAPVKVYDPDGKPLPPPALIPLNNSKESAFPADD